MGVIQKIGVFTSGGDAPGMNACLRAVVRKSVSVGLDVVGIRRGYQGMIEGDFVDMDSKSVSNIVQKGGTILKSARSKAFRTPEGRALAAGFLKQAGIQGLVAIGGDGTLAGASVFYDEYKIPLVGCPGTIDNDRRDYDTVFNAFLSISEKIDIGFFLSGLGWIRWR